ncbi:putative late blight resistance protein R1A-10 [Salvia divinorum]|uniref:Late blight resistance protein R1A-10 n=1 Tax=Salvia divinorum TaxID=28513 RepID=A0ABD1FSR3_SALDI
MAYAAVISLRHSIERLVNPTIDPGITKSAYEELGGSQQQHQHQKDLDDEGVKEEIESFMKIAKKLGEEYNRELDNDEDADVSTIDDFSGKKSTVVGLSDQCAEIRDKLLDPESRCKIVSIVGMAGIGKTVLAREVHQDLIHHFDLTAWVSLGPTRRMEDVLVDVLSQIDPTASYADEDKHTLADCLYMILYGRKYFVVLDDIWNPKEWGYLMNFFPGNNNGCRLLLSTRLQKVPSPVDTMYVAHNMRLLNNEQSWNLLSQNVFGEEYSPPELEKVGRNIAENCEGLPLLILAVACILSESASHDPKYWEDVLYKRNDSTFAVAYEMISKVLSSSYEYLPQDLKACFLYMGVFPQNCEIPFTKLINLWTVEDFLEPSQFCEDFATKCLKELVYRSLVIVCKRSSNNGIKSCKLHSAYWSLCNKEATKTQFLHVFNKWSDSVEDCIHSQRRISVQNNILFGIKEVYDSIAAASTTRSLLCTGLYLQYPVPVCIDVMFLKVLDALSIRFYEFPSEMLKLLHLQYLALTHDGNLPSFISKLQNLQSLIINEHQSITSVSDPTSLPRDIWDMQELRHLWIIGSNLPDPIEGAELPKLLTLHVKGHTCTKDTFRGIPKLKKLVINIELQPRSREILSCLEHISILDKLESLKCVVVNPRPRFKVVNPTSSFPRGLKKLSLAGLGHSWEYMSAIGSLPNLQVLKLRYLAFRGPKWKTEVGEFRNLKFLQLEDIDLVHWTSDDDNCFPRLQRLIMRHCYKMMEMPLQIENIPTLETIEIADCNLIIMLLAKSMKMRKESSGNDFFPVSVTSSLNLL